MRRLQQPSMWRHISLHGALCVFVCIISGIHWNYSCNNKGLLQAKTGGSCWPDIIRPCGDTGKTTKPNLQPATCNSAKQQLHRNCRLQQRHKFSDCASFKWKINAFWFVTLCNTTRAYRHVICGRMASRRLSSSSNKKKTLWPLVRERTIPTERPPLVDEI
jgi:hypothetical protein